MILALNLNEYAINSYKIIEKNEDSWFILKLCIGECTIQSREVFKGKDAISCE